MVSEKRYWKIHVASWGTLWATGTERQAEDWRRHKANWEACVATKTEVLSDDLPDDREGWDDLGDLLG